MKIAFILAFFIVPISSFAQISESDYARVQTLTAGCRPNCDSSLVSMTAEGIMRLWERDTSKKVVPKADAPKPDLRIRYNWLSKKIEDKRTEWQSCRDNCKITFVTELGQLYIDLWYEAAHPTPVKKPKVMTQ